MTSARAIWGSASALQPLLLTCVMSRKDMVLLACGSRSMRRVGFPRRASAAARLMAVGVFPTPPFWFAMATIIEGCTDCNTPSHHRTPLDRDISPTIRRAPLHLVLAEVVRIEALE